MFLIVFKCHAQSRYTACMELFFQFFGIFPIEEGLLQDIERPLYISKVTKKEDHTVIAYRYLDMDNIFCIPFIDDASIENALNCLAACLYLMTPADQITERMARLEPIAMRLEVKEGKNSCILINDSYNSDLASLDIALDFLVRRSEKKGLNRIFVGEQAVDRREFTVGEQVGGGSGFDDAAGVQHVAAGGGTR